MFGSIGGPELILIFVVALLIFGPRKLPELGRMLGKGLGEFRRATNDLRVSLETEVAREAPGRPATLPAPGALPRAGTGPVPRPDDVHPAAAPSPAAIPEPGETATPPADPDARDHTGTR